MTSSRDSASAMRPSEAARSAASGVEPASTRAATQSPVKSGCSSATGCTLTWGRDTNSSLAGHDVARAPPGGHGPIKDARPRPDSGARRIAP